ncbi:PREDICTED: unknown [Prunus dulcis]|uniref:Uncharacterized protein n=1 Tax=Prunus dulcis TaxID=3755 RepID=A0A5E4F5E0_PRUDU|nr:uncharacterized protein LOC117631365 [Prunus dulcis]XP_034222143.1 uncharacterized protein LOC117632700 [Prunus dulcis]KAI5321056.1 hypothetical protein L3X38_030126 [Prunus dulcis]VVA23213.1 PREDICTED: unknown [Prunus dulcis]VVA31846.1 PREDICTED: unknown [Prunus dulcis]
MEKEGKSQRESKATESDFVLQWGNRKRLRCAKVKKDQSLSNTKSSDCLRKKKIASRAEKESPAPLPQRIDKNSDSPMNSGKLFVTSPEKEDRYYTTRGSIGLDDNGKVLGLDYPGHARDDKGGHVWPRLFLSLSSKEKEEDFMAMKGCKLPQRPKKRAKLLQKSLLLVMPGVWLSDLCQERYEVREKKASKKRPRGLKAMGSMDSDSD